MDEYLISCNEPMAIPSGAYNLLPDFADAISTFKARLADCSWMHWNKKYEQNLHRLEEICSIDGPVLYSMYGGFDPHHQFSLSKSLTDVLSQGAEAFGSPHAITNCLSDPPPLVLQMAGQAYDLSMDLGRVEKKYHSCGALAIARVLLLSDTEISGVYYFGLNSKGALQFHDKEEVRLSDSLQKHGAKNAVIEFMQEGALKHFWYFSHWIRSKSEDNKTPFGKFLATQRFQTLLIKGAHRMWDGCTNPEMIFHLALGPSRNNHARVVADSNNTGTQPGEHYTRPIWQAGYRPNRFNMSNLSDSAELLRFGYGYAIDYGNADSLICEEELMSALRYSAT